MLFVLDKLAGNYNEKFIIVNWKTMCSYWIVFRHIVPKEKTSDRNTSTNSTSGAFSIKNKYPEESDID